MRGTLVCFPRDDPGAGYCCIGGTLTPLGGIAGGGPAALYSF